MKKRIASILLAVIVAVPMIAMPQKASAEEPEGYTVVMSQEEINAMWHKVDQMSLIGSLESIMSAPSALPEVVKAAGEVITTLKTSVAGISPAVAGGFATLLGLGGVAMEMTDWDKKLEDGLPAFTTLTNGMQLLPMKKEYAEKVNGVVTQVYNGFGFVGAKVKDIAGKAMDIVSGAWDGFYDWMKNTFFGDKFDSPTVTQTMSLAGFSYVGSNGTGSDWYYNYNDGAYFGAGGKYLKFDKSAAYVSGNVGSSWGRVGIVVLISLTGGVSRCESLTSTGSRTNPYFEFDASGLSGLKGYGYDNKPPVNVPSTIPPAKSYVQMPSIPNVAGNTDYQDLKLLLDETKTLTPEEIAGWAEPSNPPVDPAIPSTKTPSVPDIIAQARAIAENEDLIGLDWDAVKKVCEDLAKGLGWIADNWPIVGTPARTRIDGICEELGKTFEELEKGVVTPVDTKTLVDSLTVVDSIRLEYEKIDDTKPAATAINWQPLTSFGGALTSVFPFSIPFDVIRIISSFASEKTEAPKFEFVIADSRYFSFLKSNAKITLDFELLAPAMPIVRAVILALFVFMLVKLTPGVIKW